MRISWIACIGAKRGMKPNADYTYKGHQIKYVDEYCPKCKRQLKQMDDMELYFCECGQYARAFGKLAETKQNIVIVEDKGQLPLFETEGF